MRRSIINRNPPLVDEDGYEVDSGDDDDRIEDAMASVAELNPYANVRIESKSGSQFAHKVSSRMLTISDILAPLTATTDLPTHPTLSKPFTSSTLSTLVADSNEMMRKENTSLWKVRHLWTALCGDPDNVELYTEDWVARQLMNLKTSAPTEATVPGSGLNTNGSGQIGDHIASADQAPTTTQGTDVQMPDAEETDNGTNRTPGGGAVLSNGVEKRDFSNAQASRDVEEAKRKPLPNGKAVKSNDAGDEAMASPQATQTNGHPSGGAQASGIASNGQSIKPSNPLDTFIHPIFDMPSGSRPDRDFGIPEQEAEDVRRLLSLFIQKQEEVCRGVKKLHSGLNKAERLRRSVLHWSKAEAHSGANRDMSDGEDWYDKDEWGLTEDLKKGQDDEEEDTATAGKKTRNRRQN